MSFSLSFCIQKLSYLGWSILPDPVRALNFVCAGHAHLQTRPGLQRGSGPDQARALPPRYLAR